MEFGHIAVGSIIGMIFSLCISVGLPIFLMFLIWKKQKARLSTFLIGGLTFIVAALVLEQILHMLVLRATGTLLTDNIWLYGLYGGLAAALFEETGRWIAMRFCMKKCQDEPNALMYGAGHGGVESILIVGVTTLSNLMTALMINSGALESSLGALDEATLELTITQLSALWTTPAYTFYLAGIERMSAIVLQIALSVMVFYALKLGKKQYWLLAFAAHFFVDFVTVVCANYMSFIIVEIFIAVLALLCAWIAFGIYKRNHNRD